MQLYGNTRLPIVWNAKLLSTWSNYETQSENRVKGYRKHLQHLSSTQHCKVRRAYCVTPSLVPSVYPGSSYSFPRQGTSLSLRLFDIHQIFFRFLFLAYLNHGSLWTIAHCDLLLSSNVRCATYVISKIIKNASKDIGLILDKLDRHVSCITVRRLRSEIDTYNQVRHLIQDTTQERDKAQ